MVAERADDYVDGILKDLPIHSTGSNPTHQGPHDLYDSRINEHIDNVLEANSISDASSYNFSQLSKPQIDAMIDRIEELSLNTLESWGPTHLK